MFYIIVLFVLALTRDHPLVAPVADVVIPNIHHIVCLIEMYQVSTLLIDPTPPLDDVTVQWGPHSTWLDHLAFLDESYNVSAPSTSTFTIPAGQLDSSLGPQCRWLDRLADSTSSCETQDSSQIFPPLPHSAWPDYFMPFNIRNIGSPSVVPNTQLSIITLVRALSSAVIILPALLGLHRLNTRRGFHINRWVALVATLMYYAIMVFDVPEQVAALAGGFAFPFACSAALRLCRTALLIPPEAPYQKYKALERSHQELTAKNNAAQDDAKTLVNEKKLLAAAVQDLDGHIITLAQELNTTSRRITKVEETLTAANQVSEDQVARLVITLAQELDTTSRRVTKVEGELAAANQLSETQAARLASCSATVASLTEEAEYADLKHETLVMLQTDAMDQNVVLQGYLTEALEEKDRADTEHAQEVQALTAKVEELRDSLDIARLGNNALSRSAWLKRLKEERFKYPLPAR